MKIKLIVSVCLLLFLVTTACNNNTQPLKEKSSNTPFVGTWKFASLVAESTEGDIFFPYGETPYGKLMYDDKGHMSVLLMRTNRARFASGDIYNGTPEEIKIAFESFDAYCGTYKIDVEKKAVIHCIEGCRFPNWEGTEQVRYYEFANANKNLTLKATLTARNKKWHLKAVLIKQ